MLFSQIFQEFTCCSRTMTAVSTLTVSLMVSTILPKCYTIIMIPVLLNYRSPVSIGVSAEYPVRSIECDICLQTCPWRIQCTLSSVHAAIGWTSRQLHLGHNSSSTDCPPLSPVETSDLLQIHIYDECPGRPAPSEPLPLLGSWGGPAGPTGRLRAAGGLFRRQRELRASGVQILLWILCGA
jgi:hypothetical protein